MHVLVDRSDARPASDIPADVLPIAVGAKRMKLVIPAETERPAGLLSRPGPTAGVAPEAALIGPGVAGTGIRSSTVQARNYLLEVLPQFRQFLGKLVQGRLGGRDAVHPRGLVPTHLVLRFRPTSEPSPRSSRISGRQSEIYATGDARSKGLCATVEQKGTAR